MYVQRNLVKAEGNEEYLAPSRIIVTNGEKAWSGECDPAKDGNFKGTCPGEFWAAVSSAFRNEKLASKSTKMLEWNFEPSEGKVRVTWEMQYDEQIVLKNIFERRLDASMNKETIKVSFKSGVVSLSFETKLEPNKAESCAANRICPSRTAETTRTPPDRPCSNAARNAKATGSLRRQ